MFLEAQIAQVHRANVTSSRRRAGVFNEGRSKFGKSTRVQQSRPVLKLWLASSQNLKKNLRASSRRGLWHGGGQHVALPARTNDQRRCADVSTGCRPTPALLQRYTHVHGQLEWFNFLFFWTLSKLSFKYMINAILVKDSSGKENQARERERSQTGTGKDKTVMGSSRNW